MASLSYILLEDTREQKPLSFSRYKEVEVTHRCKLHVGDYAVIYKAEKRGRLHYSPSSIYFDRKSKGDLFGTFGNEDNRQRFKREIDTSVQLGIDLKVVVECDSLEIVKGYVHSKAPGLSLLRKLETMRRRYSVEFIYCTDRNDMKRKMFERWVAEAKEWYGGL